MTDFILNNKEWIFSGAGVAILAFIMNLVLNRQGDAMSQSNTVNNQINITPNGKNKSNNDTSCSNLAECDLDFAKTKTKILFIDDDSRFRVVKILQKTGWVKSKTVKDIDSLDSDLVINTDIFFVDIQGVGISLGFKDEGLGLALAIKDKYPNKKVIIYSAETKGERFHEALRKADTFIAKDADPYEFQQIVEKYSIEVM